MNIKCARCGYEYDEAITDMPVIKMVAEDGTHYIGCRKCFEELGAAKTESEQLQIISEMRVENDNLHESDS